MADLAPLITRAQNLADMLTLLRAQAESLARDIHASIPPTNFSAELHWLPGTLDTALRTLESATTDLLIEEAVSALPETTSDDEYEAAIEAAIEATVSQRRQQRRLAA